MSRAGQFIRKLVDDSAPDLAVLLAWAFLSALLPLFLAIFAVAGFLLRDSLRLEQLSETLYALLPPQPAGTVREILAQTEQRAGVAGVVSILLLLFNGSNAFASMERVFNVAYGIPPRNVIVQRLLGLIMLLVISMLLLVSTLAYSAGEVLGSASETLLQSMPLPPLENASLAGVMGSSISLVTAVAMFWLLYTILPNKKMGWRLTLPGAVIAAGLFFAILHLFPLYLGLFGSGFATYAAFGVFLVLMLWLYVLGLILIFGVELNAFLERPSPTDTTIQVAFKNGTHSGC